MNTLNQVVEEITGEEKQIAFRTFAVKDLETAAEAGRRISFFNEQMENIDQIVEAQIKPFLEKIEKIKAWGEEAKKEYEEKQSFYANQLEFFIREEVKKQQEAGKKPKKTISLPYGKIALKKQQPEFQKDEEALMEYAKQTGYIKVKESTDWATLKKQCEVINGHLVDKETGEVVPGVSVKERDDKFELKLD
jgi:HD superfamily phosphodiesterase